MSKKSSYANWIIIGCIVILGAILIFEHGGHEKEEHAIEMHTDIQHDWIWLETKYSDGQSMEPRSNTPFIVTLGADQSIHMTGDCNIWGGMYTILPENTIDITLMTSTKKACIESQENSITRDLNKVERYLSHKNILSLVLSENLGTMTFSRRIKAE